MDASSAALGEQAQTLNHYPRCFGCGEANPSGLGLAPTWHRDEATLDYLPPVDAEGGPGIVHGGYLAAIADEMAALVVAKVAHEPAMTQRIEVKFRAPAMVAEPVHVRASVVDRGRRRIVVGVTASAVSPARELFTAEAIFLTVPRRTWLRMMVKAGRGPDRVDWGHSDMSTYVNWQMHGGLAAFFTGEGLEHDIRVAIRLADVGAGQWLLTATSDGLVVSEGTRDEWDVLVSTSFRPFQMLLHRSTTIGQLIESGDVDITGNGEVLAKLLDSLDFRSVL